MVIRTSPLASIVLIDSFSNRTGIHVFELSDVFQAVQSVSSKSADGFGNNHINVTSLTGVDCSHLHGTSFVDGFARVASTEEKAIGTAIGTVDGLVSGMK